ncbi:MAG: hypothetical protein GC187_03075 [Alphaproteobacteria bacterium]|nr:hypothetical protein [Alphaproteobacteria bacterium]
MAEGGGKREEAKTGQTAFVAGLPIGIGAGMAIGVAIGVAFDDIALGLAFGVAFGVALAPAFGASRTKSKQNSPDAPGTDASKEENSQ